MALGKKTGGRTKGTPNRRTVQREKQAKEFGLTPLDYMLYCLNDETLPVDIRLEAAGKAAPYVHRKLPTALEITDMQTPEEWLEELD